MTDNVVLNLNDNTDAQAWAKEFIRCWNGHRIGNDKTVDEGLMIAWFANAIMAGFDEASRRQQKHIDKLKSLLLLVDPAVCSVEMNDLSMKQFDAYERWCQTET